MTAQTIAAVNAVEILDTVAPASVMRTTDAKGGTVQFGAAALAELLRWAAENPAAALAAAAEIG